MAARKKVHPWLLRASGLLSFSKRRPGLQLAWDATSLQSFMACPRRYLYECVYGLRLAGRGKDIEFGHKFHGALEVFDKARLAGAAVEGAMYEALDYVLKVSGEAVWFCTDCKRPLPAPPEGATDCPNCNATEFSETWVPWETEDTKKNRYTLVRAVIWYCDEQREQGGWQAYKFPDGQPAVELSFRLPLPIQTRDGEQYLLCGHMDGLATWDDTDVYIRERKTTQQTLGGAFFRKYAPNVQVDTYDLVGWLLYSGLKIKGVIMEVAQTAVSFARFYRHPLTSTKSRREEWLAEILDSIKEAEKCACKGHWPMRRSVCTLYGGCPFQNVCRRDPAQREAALRADYVYNGWDPLETR